MSFKNKSPEQRTLEKKAEGKITKRNKPIAQLVPIGEEETSLFGAMKGTVHILSDIIEPIEEKWNADY